MKDHEKDTSIVYRGPDALHGVKVQSRAFWVASKAIRDGQAETMPNRTSQGLVSFWAPEVRLCWLHKVESPLSSVLEQRHIYVSLSSRLIWSHLIYFIQYRTDAMYFHQSQLHVLVQAELLTLLLLSKVCHKAHWEPQSRGHVFAGLSWRYHDSQWFQSWWKYRPLRNGCRSYFLLEILEHMYAADAKRPHRDQALGQPLPSEHPFHADHWENWQSWRSALGFNRKDLDAWRLESLPVLFATALFQGACLGFDDIPVAPVQRNLPCAYDSPNVCVTSWYFLHLKNFDSTHVTSTKSFELVLLIYQNKFWDFPRSAAGICEPDRLAGLSGTLFWQMWVSLSTRCE